MRGGGEPSGGGGCSGGRDSLGGERGGAKLGGESEGGGLLDNVGSEGGGLLDKGGRAAAVFGLVALVGAVVVDGVGEFVEVFGLAGREE